MPGALRTVALSFGILGLAMLATWHSMAKTMGERTELETRPWSPYTVMVKRPEPGVREIQATHDTFQQREWAQLFRRSHHQDVREGPSQGGEGAHGGPRASPWLERVSALARMVRGGSGRGRGRGRGGDEQGMGESDIERRRVDPLRTAYRAQEMRQGESNRIRSGHVVGEMREGGQGREGRSGSGQGEEAGQELAEGKGTEAGGGGVKMGWERQEEDRSGGERGNGRTVPKWVREDGGGQTVVHDCGGNCVSKGVVAPFNPLSEYEHRTSQADLHNPPKWATRDYRRPERAHQEAQRSERSHQEAQGPERAHQEALERAQGKGTGSEHVQSKRQGGMQERGAGEEGRGEEGQGASEQGVERDNRDRSMEAETDLKELERWQDGGDESGDDGGKAEVHSRAVAKMGGGKAEGSLSALEKRISSNQKSAEDSNAEFRRMMGELTGKPVHSSSSASPSAREEEDAANLSGVPSRRRLEAEEEKEDMLVKEGSSLKAKLGSFLHKASIKANGGAIGASGSPL